MSRPHGSVERPRVVLYTRPGCHLCDDARAVVEQVCTAAGERWREVDIEVGPDGGAHGAGGGGDLVEKYGDYVPVVEVDGVQQGFWRVDAARLARRLAR
ncbi:glutaredoxin family protein [Isoptericola sp. NEAU-Y5]|uniref:Glutaredoxin family protein n=1 Tax=Isoptericola luteus TaxID=2879484 RepID=A0ABS7ZJI3_9MICO|nr:glutaredoxin family protein [Isoptericola sp. NEAU-Y5]MCA5895078.1 glutaredoxin family protein [Isoptericola sp. NEAU-Y5]